MKSKTISKTSIVLVMTVGLAFCQAAQAAGGYNAIQSRSNIAHTPELIHTLPNEASIIETPGIVNIIPPISPIVPVVSQTSALLIPNAPITQSVIQTTLNNASTNALRFSSAPAGLSVSFDDAVSQAGGDAATDPVTIATVGDALLAYSISDMTIVESLAPAAGESSLQREAMKDIMNHVYDQVIKLDQPVEQSFL